MFLGQIEPGEGNFGHGKSELSVWIGDVQIDQMVTAFLNLFCLLKKKYF
jgi:hypothetical protein